MSTARQALLPVLVIQASLVVSGILTARILGPTQRGELALAQLLPTVLAIVGTLGFPSALTYFVAKTGSHVHLGRATIGFAVFLLCGLTLVEAALLIVFFGSRTAAVFSAVIPTVLVAPLGLYQMLITAIHQGRSDFTAMNVTRVVPLVAWGVGVGILAGFGLLTLSSACLAFLGAYVIAAIVATGSLGRISFDSTIPSLPLRGMLGFGLRGLVGTVSPLENLRLDQLVVGAFQTAYSLGIYSTAQAFYTLPRLLGQSIGMLAYPSVAKTSGGRQRALVVWICLVSAIALGALTALIIVALPVAIPLLFGTAFDPSIPVAQVLVLGSFFLAFRRLAADLLRGLGRPGSDSFVEVASWPVLALGLFLAARRGPIDVAAAVAATALMGFVVSVLLLARVVRHALADASVQATAGTKVATEG